MTLVQTNDPSEFWMCLRLPTRESRRKHFVGKKRTKEYHVKSATVAVVDPVSRDYAPVALPPLHSEKVPKVQNPEFVGPPDLQRREGELVLCWIKRWVAHNHGVTVSDLEGPRRFRHLVAARQEYFYHAKTIAKRSYPVIGKNCGGRDHTTCLYGALKHADKLGESHTVLENDGYTT